MLDAAYVSGRQKYQRPQAVLWANNPGGLSDGGYVPEGFEIGAITSSTSGLNEFLILSDDNRAPLDFSTERIENRERMINGRMRSYHVADKLQLSTSWKMLPSRSFATVSNFSTDPENPGVSLNSSSLEYTTDGGAGGAEILKWYENHKGSFWVYLSYDKYTNFGSDALAYTHLPQYSQVIEMYISDFSYSVQKRGGNNFDFWDISVKLEEV